MSCCCRLNTLDRCVTCNLWDMQSRFGFISHHLQVCVNSIDKVRDDNEYIVMPKCALDVMCLNN